LICDFTAAALYPYAGGFAFMARAVSGIVTFELGLAFAFGAFTTVGAVFFLTLPAVLARLPSYSLIHRRKS
jgi:hypothetical protein